jgi:hypothetical protein
VTIAHGGRETQSREWGSGKGAWWHGGMEPQHVQQKEAESDREREEEEGK